MLAKAPNNKGVILGAKAHSIDRYAVLQRKLDELERIHADGKKAYQADLDRLKGELSRTQKANSEQADRLQKLKKQNEALDARIIELKKTNTAEELENRELRVKLRSAENERVQLVSKQGEAGDVRKALQALEAKRRDEGRESERRIAELEKLVVAEKKRREMAEARTQELRGTAETEVKEARLSARQEETRMKEARVLAEEAQAALALAREEGNNREDQLLSRLTDMQLLLKRVAEDYGRLANSSVPASTHDSLRLEHAGLQMQAMRLERKLANSEGQVVELANLIRQTKDENSILLASLDDSTRQVAFYSNAWRDGLQDRFSMDEVDDLIGELFRAKSNMWRVQQTLYDASFATHRLSYEAFRLIAHSTLISYATSVGDLDGAYRTVRQYSSTLKAAEVSRTALDSDLHTLRTERDTVLSQLATAVSSMEISKANEGALTKQLKALESKIQELQASQEQALKKEREASQRMAVSVQKHKMAEEALRAEIEQLTSELTDAERYQEAYQSLIEEVEALAARNELAEDEAERLSKFNAEILGHNNPAQRVMYLDRIRRELAETKQALLTVTLDRDAVIAHGDGLQHELNMYKSIAVPSEFKPRTTITRVGRVPLVNQSTNVGSTTHSKAGDFAKMNGRRSLNVDGEMTLDEII